MNALALDSGLRLVNSDDQRVVDLLRADLAHERLLRRAVFALAVELQRTVIAKEAIIRRQDELLARLARSMFLPCGEADV